MSRARNHLIRIGGPLLGFWLALVPSTLVAELVLLVDGGVIKVRDYQRSGDQIRLDLPSGGSMTISVLRVDRILADEIEASDEALPSNEIAIGFAAGHGVPATPYGDLIFEVARRHSINPGLIAAMVEVESAFDAKAVSKKGAAGLLQLMPATARRFGLGRRDLFDPERNLDTGVRYVRFLNDRFAGRLPLVLAGYNAGEAAVDRHEGVPPYKETRDYIRRVYSAAAGASADRARE